MDTSYHVAHAAEVCDQGSPTGEYVEVLAGEVRDYGGNVHFSGSADECVEFAARFRLPHHLTPTQTRKLDRPIRGADHTWSYTS